MVEFDEPKVDVLEGRKDVFGTVTATEDISSGIQAIKFCVVCSQISEQEGTGSSMQFKNCGIPIKVDAINARTRENIPLIPEKPSPIQSTALIAIIVIAVLLLLIFWYLHEKKKNPLFNKPRSL